MAEKKKNRKTRNWPSIHGTPDQRASRGLSRLEDITRLISEWVWEAEPDGTLSFVSHRTMEALGYAPFQLVGQKLTELGDFYTEEGENYVPDWEKPFREVLFITKNLDGEDKSFLVSGLPFYNPETWKFEGVCGTAEDITEQRNYEGNLLQAKHQADAANQAKSQFLSSMSHELRTPMNSVLGFAQLLENSSLNSEQSTYVRYILNSGQLLMTLIDDILDLSRIEKGDLALELTPIDPKAVIEETVEQAKVLAVKYNVTVTNLLEDQPQPFITADPYRLKQVLLNLMSNAIKYNFEEGEVRVDGKEIDEGFYRITVSDTGQGISQEYHEKIFTSFERLGRENSTVEGTGIGLLIAKNLIERMGGKINFESQENAGSTFWFDLPLV